jgi:hypothetical protein
MGRFPKHRSRDQDAHSTRIDRPYPDCIPITGARNADVHWLDGSSKRVPSITISMIGLVELAKGFW